MLTVEYTHHLLHPASSTSPPYFTSSIISRFITAFGILYHPKKHFPTILSKQQTINCLTALPHPVSISSMCQPRKHPSVLASSFNWQDSYDRRCVISKQFVDSVKPSTVIILLLPPKNILLLDSVILQRRTPGNICLYIISSRCCKINKFTITDSGL